MTTFVRPLDLLLAFKAIALTPLLMDRERRVACVLLDHFNRKTGQCDPSLGTIAKLLDINRRTAIRAVTRLHQLGFILRNVHGGKFHRNSYTPEWGKFRQIEAHWKARRSQQQKNVVRPNVSPWQRPGGHVESVSSVTQTCL
jgi:predicted transcriptional regulator